MSNDAISTALCLSSQAENILNNHGLSKDEIKDAAALYKKAAKVLSSSVVLLGEGCNQVVSK